jgi:hypothetical protein
MPVRPTRFRKVHGTAVMTRGTLRKRYQAVPFRRVRRRSLRLLGRWIAKTTAGGTHVPEIAAYQIALARIVVQNRRERGIGVRLRLLKRVRIEPG